MGVGAVILITTVALGGTPEATACGPAVAWYARPSNTPCYVGYYVGGGCPCRGDGRTSEEGTWGWDYQGCCLPRCVRLWWSHGRCHQGGKGAYETDGPTFPPPPRCPSGH
jgi:hypothetical protein